MRYLPEFLDARVRRARATAAVVLMTLLLASCVAFPGEELATYREAYLESQKAGELLYDELAKAVVRSGGGPAEANCARGQTAPTCFDPAVALDDGTGADIPSIRARRLALRSVEAYNLAVIDLLDGKSGDQLSSRILELRDVASDLLALGGVAGGQLPALIGGQGAVLLGNLVNRLDSLAARQAARASLIEDAALVDEMIAALIADTPAMYKLYKTAQAGYAIDLELSGGTGNKAALDAYARIGAYHDQLSAYVKLLDQDRKSFARLIAVLKTGTGSASDTRAAIREAIEIRKAAEEFWAEVRKAR